MRTRSNVVGGVDGNLTNSPLDFADFVGRKQDSASRDTRPELPAVGEAGFRHSA